MTTSAAGVQRLLVCASLLVTTTAAHADEELSDKVLDASQFSGGVKHAYQQAKQYAKAAKQQFCYCGCDVTEKHTSLLDCFIDPSEHAVECKECVDEMHITANMMAHRKSVADVQQAIHRKYIKMYPFDTPSAAYDAFLRKAGLNPDPEIVADPIPSAPPLTATNEKKSERAENK